MPSPPVRFDARDAARLERMYAAPEIVEQRVRTRAALAARPGETGLDVGCGPGLLACELAREVGPTGMITAFDTSPDMIEAARARAERDGIADRVAFTLGDAARLAFPTASFDFVVGVQVYLYVTQIERALTEAARVLRPAGRLVIVDTDWDSCVWLTSDPARHARVMAARLGHFAHPHLPPRLPKLLRAAGLTLTHASVIPILDLGDAPDSFSVGSIGTTRSIAIRHGASPEEAEAWEADLQSRTGDGDYFFSLNRFLFAAEKR